MRYSLGLAQENTQLEPQLEELLVTGSGAPARVARWADARKERLKGAERAGVPGLGCWHW